MDYIDKIFARLDIQHIREFLLYGMECAQITPKSYQQRLDEAWEPVNAIIKNKFPCEKEQEEIIIELSRLTTVTQDVFVEIGMQCGAALTTQFTPKTDVYFEKAHPE